MKKTGIYTVLFILLVSVSSVLAGPQGMGNKAERGWKMESCLLTELNLTPEQTEKVRVLREKHQNSIMPIRTQKFEEGAQLKLLWMQVDPDVSKIKASQKKIHDLRWQLTEKNREYRLSLRKILTPEQLSKYLALKSQWDGHHGRMKMKNKCGRRMNPACRMNP